MESTPKGNVFSGRLKKLRGDRSKAEFARFLGFLAPVYQRYECGRIPSANNLSVIASRCSVTVEWLLGNESHTDKHEFDPALMAVPKDVHSRLLWLKGAVSRIEAVDERTRHHLCAAAKTEIDDILRLCDMIIGQQSETPGSSKTADEEIP